MAGNDGQAFGVLQALGERGLRAPDDLSVVGFDDVPVASWATPALTTVRQPLAAMAATAFRMLRSDPATAAGEPHHIELATTLVIMSGSGPIRSPCRVPRHPGLLVQPGSGEDWHELRPGTTDATAS